MGSACPCVLVSAAFCAAVAGACVGRVTKIETWLILPVVIRSSQRLSHACLSINIYTVKLRMAHYISYSLFDSPYYLDNRSNSRANTCTKTRLLAEGLYLLDISQWRACPCFGESQ